MARLETAEGTKFSASEAAAKKVIDAAVDDLAKGFFDKAEAHVHVQENETFVAPSSTKIVLFRSGAELNRIVDDFQAPIFVPDAASKTTRNISYREWLDGQIEKSYILSEEMVYEVKTEVGGEEQKYVVPLAELMMDAGLVHEAVDSLISEYEDTNDFGIDEEQFMEELEKLFGEEGYVIVDTEETALPVEASESTDINDAVDALVNQFGVGEEATDACVLDLDFEEFSRALIDMDIMVAKELDADGNEVLFLIDVRAEETETDTVVLSEPKTTTETVDRAMPIAKEIEEHIQELTASEPERFAALPETEQPMVLIMEMQQIAEALHDLAIEQAALGIQNEKTMALYEQRLEVVIAKLLYMIDPEFHQARVNEIIKELLADLENDGTHEAKLHWVDDTPPDDGMPWYMVGGLVVRAQFALIA